MSIRPLGNGTWELSLYLPGNRRDKNRRIKRRFDDETVATNWHSRLKLAMQLGGTTLRDVLAELNGLRQAASILVSELLDRYYDEYAKLRNRARGLPTKFSRIGILKAELGHLVAAELLDTDISRYESARRKLGRSNASINRETSILRHACNWGVRAHLLPVNPLRDHEKLPEPRKLPRRDLETAIAKVFEKIPETHKPVFIFLYETGARKSHGLGLKHTDVLLEEQLAELPRIKECPPQYLGLTARAIEAIKSVPRIPGCDYVFYNPNTLTRWMDCRKAWETAREAAGFKDLRIKDLRTAFGSRLSDLEGLEKHAIQTMMNHSSIRTTEERYAFHDQKKAIRRALKLIDGGRKEGAA